MVGSQINSLNNDPTNLPSSTSEEAKEYVKANLEAYEYTVRFVDKTNTEKSIRALVSMNVSGDRNLQVIYSALILNSAQYFNDATEYGIYLVSSEQTCSYIISVLPIRDFVNAYHGKNVIVDGDEYGVDEISSYIVDEIESSEYCFQP